VQTYQGAAQLDALGDPSRRAIVALLSEDPMPVGALAARLPISRPAVSQHLSVLKAAGLVRDRAEGTRRVYSLDDTGLGEIRAFLAAYWQDDLHDFARHAAEQARQAGGARAAEAT
jgi:DNA-binding transcriptional ArsR family regulator